MIAGDPMDLRPPAVNKWQGPSSSSQPAKAATGQWTRLRELPIPKGLGIGKVILKVLKPMLEMIRYRASPQAISDAIDNYYYSGQFGETVSNQDQFCEKIYFTVDALLNACVDDPSMEKEMGFRVEETDVSQQMVVFRSGMIMSKLGKRFKRSKEMRSMKTPSEFIAEQFWGREGNLVYPRNRRRMDWILQDETREL